MTHSHIRLNFLALTPQNFAISCWRQRVGPQEIKPNERFIWRYDLAERANDERSPKQSYLVRFTRSEGFDEFSLDSHIHRDLSNAALFHALQDKVSVTLPNDKYYISQTAFRPRRLSFTMNSTKIGKQTVWLEPYYLEAAHKIGFLIDFKFLLDRNVSFGREAQRLSLSLDRSYRSNKDCYIDRFEFVNRFLHEISPKLFPMKMASGAEIGLDPSLVELPTERLNEKVFVFGGGNKGPSQWNGLNKFGPFAPAPKPIRFVYVYRKNQRTLAEDLYKGIDGKIQDFPRVLQCPIESSRTVEIMKNGAYRWS